MSLFAHWTFDRWSASIGGARKFFTSARFFWIIDMMMLVWMKLPSVERRYSSLRLIRAYGIFVEEIAAFHPILEEHRLDFICFTRLNIDSVAD
jgi:hypothetical protein